MCVASGELGKLFLAQGSSEKGVGLGAVFGAADAVDSVRLIARDGEARHHGGEEDEICRRMYGFGEE